MGLFNCKEVMRLISEGEDHKLPWGKRVVMRMHLLMCASCRVCSAQLQMLGRLMRGVAEADVDGGGEGLRDEVRERIKHCMKDRGNPK